MSNQSITSDLLVELSTDQQQLLSGGQRRRRGGGRRSFSGGGGRQEWNCLDCIPLDDFENEEFGVRSGGGGGRRRGRR